MDNNSNTNIKLNNLFVREGKHNIHNRFTFNTTAGEMVLTPEDAIEIALTLFDWAKQPYTPIEEIQERIERGEL